MVLAKDGEDQLDWSSVKRSAAESRRDGTSYLTINRKTTNWIGHILCRNSLLQYVTEGKIEGRTGVMGRRGRRRRQLLDDLIETRRYLKLKVEALDHTV